jgi:hypothetical protein
MRAAASFLTLLLALTACNNDAPQQAHSNNAAATDIEALPADESAATPTDELENGAAEPAANVVE